MSTKLFPQLHTYLQEREQEFDQIPETRKQELIELSVYLKRKYESGETPQLIVICTHNSRRSHMGQLWLSVGAELYGLPKLEAYSGGTEATAFNTRSVSALRKTGLDIQTETPEANNPRYEVSWNTAMKSYLAYSKKFGDPPNPASHFAAIMVCTSADEACPIVAGADFRLSLPYQDPKAFDDTDLEAEKYEERARQIAREILFALKKVS